MSSYTITWPLAGRGAPSDPTEGGNPYYWMRRRAYELVGPQSTSDEERRRSAAFCAAQRCGVSAERDGLSILGPPTGCSIRSIFAWICWDPRSSPACLCGDRDCRLDEIDTDHATSSRHRFAVNGTCRRILEHPSLRDMEEILGPWTPEDTAAAVDRVRTASNGLRSAGAAYKSWSVSGGGPDTDRLRLSLKSAVGRVKACLDPQKVSLAIPPAGASALAMHVNGRSRYLFTGASMSSYLCSMRTALAALLQLECALNKGPAEDPETISGIDALVDHCADLSRATDIVPEQGQHRAPDWHLDDV